MTAPPRISVIVPAFNAAPTISRTLHAATAQTFRDIEIVVADDGSTDETPDIVARHAARDRRIRLVRQANAGLAAARNRAIDAARGQFVAPLDADDLWHPEKLLRQLEVFDSASPAAAMVYCWYVSIDSDDHVLAGGPAAEYEGDVLAALILDNFIGCASIPLIRRAAVVEAGGYDRSLREAGAQGCEDLRLYLRLAERHTVGVARGYLVGYRQSAASMSRDAAAMLRSRRLVMTDVQVRHPELPARLFALSDAGILFWYARRCLHAGSPATAGRLLLRALIAAPAAVAGPLALASLSRLAARRRRPAAAPFGSDPIFDPGYARLAAWQRRVLGELRGSTEQLPL